MAIYETSRRSALLVRMASFLLLGSKQRGGNASNDQHSRNNDKFDSWPATAAVGVGLAVFLYLTGTYSNVSKDRIRNKSGSETEKDLSLVSRFESGDAVTSIFGVCRTIVCVLAESLKSLSKSGADDAFLIRTRLKALENARVGQSAQQADDMTITLHSGSCQCNAVKFQVRAPRTLNVYQVPKEDCSSIQYPQIRIPAKDFILRTGHSNIQSFQSLTDTCDGAQVTAAHTFCSRCGVHLLHATKSSSYVYLNALTLRKNSFIPKIVFSFEDADEICATKDDTNFYADSESGSETKRTSQSTASNDSIDVPMHQPLTANITSPPSPISVRSDYHDSGRKQVSSVCDSVTQIINDDCDSVADDFESNSIKSSLTNRSFRLRRSSHGSFRSYGASSIVSAGRSRRTKSTGSYNNNSKNGPNSGFSSSNSIRSLRPYTVDAGFAEMDAQSVASSISENVYSTTLALESVSVYSRGSSQRSIQSVEQSHGQLLKYLAKHVTPRNNTSATTSDTTSPDENDIGNLVSNNSPRLYELQAVAQLELQQPDVIEL